MIAATKTAYINRQNLFDPNSSEKRMTGNKQYRHAGTLSNHSNYGFYGICIISQDTIRVTMKEKKAYRVTIELANDEFIVSASTKAEARQKAIARLDRKRLHPIYEKLARQSQTN